MTETHTDDALTTTAEAPAEAVVEIDVKPAAEEPCGELPLEVRIEGVLLSTDRALTEARLAEILGLQGTGSVKRIRAAIETLNGQYAKGGRAFRIERLAGGWQILTQPALGPLLARQHRDRQQSRLSPAALETLAIVSYRQPIVRAEIEAIRGVSCGEVLRGLLERRLVKIVGRADDIGRPMLYGTTREFLHVFGLASLDDLPAVEGLDRGQRSRWKPKAAPEAPADETPADETPADEPQDAVEPEATDESVEPRAASDDTEHDQPS